MGLVEVLMSPVKKNLLSFKQIERHRIPTDGNENITFITEKQYWRTWLSSGRVAWKHFPELNHMQYKHSSFLRHDCSLRGGFSDMDKGVWIYVQTQELETVIEVVRQHFPKCVPWNTNLEKRWTGTKVFHGQMPLEKTIQCSPLRIVMHPWAY